MTYFARHLFFFPLKLASYCIISAARRAFLRPRKDLGQVREGFAEDLALIMLDPLQTSCWLALLILSRGRRNADWSADNESVLAR